MKKIKKTILFNGFGLFILIFLISLLSNCAVNDDVKAKSGAQLWGESCLRCHNNPSPETFGDVDWDVAVMHMRIRANLTDEEAKKIAKFLKTAN
ncbi:MAG: cytochrome c [Bacteroidales bacterium]|nr:cytochrome c [Bacteroidales bacterium]